MNNTERYKYYVLHYYICNTNNTKQAH